MTAAAGRNLASPSSSRNSVHGHKVSFKDSARCTKNKVTSMNLGNVVSARIGRGPRSRGSLHRRTPHFDVATRRLRTRPAGELRYYASLEERQGAFKFVSQFQICLPCRRHPVWDGCCTWQMPKPSGRRAHVAHQMQPGIWSLLVCRPGAGRQQLTEDC
jgi:hypothetical protein